MWQVRPGLDRQGAAAAEARIDLEEPRLGAGGRFRTPALAAEHAPDALEVPDERGGRLDQLLAGQATVQQEGYAVLALVQYLLQRVWHGGRLQLSDGSYGRFDDAEGVTQQLAQRASARAKPAFLVERILAPPGVWSGSGQVYPTSRRAQRTL